MVLGVVEYIFSLALSRHSFVVLLIVKKMSTKNLECGGGRNKSKHWVYGLFQEFLCYKLDFYLLGDGIMINKTKELRIWKKKGFKILKKAMAPNML